MAKKDYPEKEQKKRLPRLARFFRAIAIVLLSGMALIIIASAVVSVTILSPKRLKALVETAGSTALGRTLTVERARFFPILGIDLKNITLLNSKAFGERTNATIDRVRVRVGVFPLFLLHANIKEIRIDNPTVYLYAGLDGAWNLPDLPPAAPPEERPVDRNAKPFALSSLDFLRPKVSVKNVRIKNANAFVEQRGTDGIRAALSDVSVSLDLVTKRFKPSDIETLAIIRRIRRFDFSIALGTNENIVFANNLIALNARLGLNLDIKANSRALDYALALNLDDPRVNMRGREIERLSVSVDQNASVDFASWSLKLKENAITLLGDTVLDMRLEAKNLKTSPRIAIDRAEGDFALAKLNPLITAFMPNVNASLDGFFRVYTRAADDEMNALVFSLETVTARLDAISANDANAAVSFSFPKNAKNASERPLGIGITAKAARAHPLPALDITALDANIEASFVSKDLTLIPKALTDATVKPAVGIEINRINLLVNDAPIRINGTLAINNPMRLSVNAKKVPLTPFVDMLGGQASAEILLRAETLNAIGLDADIAIDNFSYSLAGDASKTAPLALTLRADANVPGQTIALQTVSLSVGDFIFLDVHGALEGFGLTQGRVGVNRLLVVPDRTEAWLSPGFARLLGMFGLTSEARCATTLDYALDLPKNVITINDTFSFALSEPGYTLTDIEGAINARVNFSPNNFNVNLYRAEITSATNDIAILATGTIGSALKDIAISYDLHFAPKQTFRLRAPVNIEFEGKADIKGTFAKNTIKATAQTEKAYFRLVTVNPMTGSPNMRLYIRDLDAALPISLDVSDTTGLALRSKSGAEDMLSKIKRPKPNLRFSDLAFLVEIDKLMSFQAQDTIRVTDFSAHAAFENGRLELADGRAHLYIGGSADSARFWKDVEEGIAPRPGVLSIPYLAANVMSQSYDVTLYGTDLNMKYLMSQDMRAKMDDEKLRINLAVNANGKEFSSVSRIISGMDTASFGVTKLSREFFVFVANWVREITPAAGLALIAVDGGFEPDKLSVAISESGADIAFYFKDMNDTRMRGHRAQMLGIEGNKVADTVTKASIIAYLEGQIGN